MSDDVSKEPGQQMKNAFKDPGRQMRDAFSKGLVQAGKKEMSFLTDWGKINLFGMGYFPFLTVNSAYGRCA